MMVLLVGHPKLWHVSKPRLPGVFHESFVLPEEGAGHGGGDHPPTTLGWWGLTVKLQAFLRPGYELRCFQMIGKFFVQLFNQPRPQKVVM